MEPGAPVTRSLGRLGFLALIWASESRLPIPASNTTGDGGSGQKPFGVPRSKL